MKSRFLTVVALLFAVASVAQNRWQIQPDGKTIRMEVEEGRYPHSDHVEMSGEMMATVLYWSVDHNRTFKLDRSLVFPMLRSIPNDTHASLIMRQPLDVVAQLRINGNIHLNFETRFVEINGGMRVVEVHPNPEYLMEVERQIFPTMKQAMMCEHYKVTNRSNSEYLLQVPSLQQEVLTNAKTGVKGSYRVLTTVKGGGAFNLKPGESVEFDVMIEGLEMGQKSQADLDVKQLMAERKAFLDVMDNNLILDTPDDVIDTQFRFAKVRASESILKTKGGYMHAPGGETYYAAVWANDQAEYVNPFFPFVGYDVGNESAINAYRHFARFMNDEWKPIPSSIIAEGDDIWNGAGDRGDGAMIAYGAARYALARADRAEAEELWTLIEWCLEYCRRKLNDKGVVESDSDELEGRFPAGDANLCTSTLYYDALISAAYLGRELGKSPKVIADYQKRAKQMRDAIEAHFGATVQGYDTYRYYEGNDILRSWICMPLCVGIYDRADATVDAMFKSELYQKDGVLTAQGSTTFWDRSTLYAFRGAYAAGHADFITEQLSYYSNRRLLGDHVPYPVEAGPGWERQLSAESGLYCRVITEGMFGIRPTGMRSFELKPEIPASWEFVSLKNIRAFGGNFDIDVKRLGGDRLRIEVSEKDGKKKTFTVKQGKTINVKL